MSNFPGGGARSHHECTITSTSKSPSQDLEGKIIELKKLAESGGAVDVADEIARLEKRVREALRDIYKALTPWQKAQVARHSDRPHCLDYVGGLFTEFTPLAGDRAFGEDHAIVCGFGRFRGEPIAVIGQEKGDDTKSRLKHNFGMAQARRLPQGGALHGTRRPLRRAGRHALSTPPAPIPASMRKNAARRKRSRGRPRHAWR